MSLNLLQTKDPSFLEFLDWNEIIQEIFIDAHFESTKNFFRPPLHVYSEIAEVEDSLNQIESFINNDYTNDVNLQRDLYQVANICEDFSFYSLLKKGTQLAFRDLNFFALLLEFYIHHRRMLIKLELFEENIDPYLQRLRSKFLNDFRKICTAEGEVDYLKHPLLKECYQEILNIEKSARKSLQRLTQSELYQDTIQYIDVDIINDHYVLAVRSDRYNAKLGKIIARSDKGNTLYIVPSELDEISLKRLELYNELDQKIYEITSQFNSVILENFYFFDTAKNTIETCDLLNCKSQYIIKKQLNRPTFNQECKIEIHSLVHPLIVNPVTNDVEIDYGHKVFLISGPNTGGKTVYLKSLSLTYLFVHLGLFVPASRAHIHLFQKIFFLGHDFQNLLEGHSSFAAESLNYLELLKEADENSLIFIDEIFNTTSSTEASALAISIFELLSTRPFIKIFASTHHQVLKAYIHQTDEYISAHVGHDSKTNSPTYKIHFGAPGSSMAINIFSKIAKNSGLEFLAHRALSLIDENYLNYEELLERLNNSIGIFQKKYNELASWEQQLEQKQKSVDGLLLLKSRELEDSLNSKLEKKIIGLEKIAEDLKKGNLSPKKMHQQIAKVHQKNILLNQNDKQSINMFPIDINHYDKNKSYFCSIVKGEVKILSLSGNTALVTYRGKKIQCPLSTLFELPNSNGHKQKININVHVQSENKISFDCRGMKLEEFQLTVEREAQALLSNGLPYLDIIHGHGDGILKKWLRNEFLRHNHEFIWDIPDGNDGMTRIQKK
ncbi:MAG: hypothetical protein H6622_02655 [Halobacteriovoraceae bacterium]|nr:hypothetical protein [Halobacteriovoraceae bacterium]